MKKQEVSSFDWDNGNTKKVQSRLSINEVEVFFYQTLSVKADVEHSKTEPRFIAAGYSEKKKPMFVCFTFREIAGVLKIRVISARYMHKKEAKAYEVFKEEHKKD